MNFIRVALQAKGPRATLRRVRSLAARYGFSPRKMAQALQQLAALLRKYDCGATFPITAVALARHPQVIADERWRHIEFAVHGYTHIDYTRLPQEEQLAHLRRARQVFAAHGLTATGFRSPYLRHDATLNRSLAAAGFSYVSNQPFLWDVLTEADVPPQARTAHQHALEFYAPWRPPTHQSLPRIAGELVEIPVSLPDDEMLVERLQASSERIARVWLGELHAAYRRGELLTLQLHPERALACAAGLEAVLQEARALRPAVWIARLDEIAAWWRARSTASLKLTPVDEHTTRVRVSGPAGIALQVRGAQVLAPTQAQGTWQLVTETEFDLRADAPVTPVEIHNTPERGAAIRLAPWPEGAQSALAITGDIDGLTLWDYGLRIWGR